MDYEEILTPVALYRDRLKAEHAENTAAAFEELLKRSGVDEAANAALVQVIRKLEKEVAELDSKLTWWKVFRWAMILVAVAGTVLGVMWLVPLCGGDDLGVKTPVGASGFGGAVLALALIFGVLNGKIKQFKELVAERRAELERIVEEEIANTGATVELLKRGCRHLVIARRGEWGQCFGPNIVGVFERKLELMKRDGKTV